uniref:Secreted protein n=1 Tax=Anguilla anguilla TaxID=7936 RepID=A0A0E9XW33_ANGAN
MLCYAVLCVMLCCAMLCCVFLCCAVNSHAVLRCVGYSSLCCAALFCSGWPLTARSFPLLHRSMLPSGCSCRACSPESK